MTDIIYDTLMGNTDNDQFRLEMVGETDCLSSEGYIGFWYHNASGDRSFIKVTVETQEHYQDYLEKA